ncbi:DUF5683 domain-containing protein [Winogradskyella sp. SYSU M77433]|uniref:DUF5683 domain-containing protein n=1 Tax=Winogradskyella sp. SYSU M77433 TaxID=3042722 RepID=UPI00248119EE|nr:DUF5683 domain-containing protein [Winogradskyella sp. SYSU M77433]MDH7912946.1 DUF5683 domain-containing protein [Winogradskyella sp. SYSU M77433]
MPNKHVFTVLLCLFSVFYAFSQQEKVKDSLGLTNEVVVLEEDLVTKKEIDPLRPSKAAFYSAILPGLGQAYNKRYWKIPLVWGAIGTGIYFYVRNDKQFDRYRDAYKRRLAGFTDDEFQNVVSDEGLIRAQEQFRRNKEVSLLVTFGLYALNIIDANVDAHLLQFNVDENLSFRPHYQYNQMENTSDLGLTMNFKF